MPITIKYLAQHPEFIPICANWAFSSWGKYNPEASLQKSIDGFTKHCQQDALPLTLIATLDDQLVGMVSLRNDDGMKNEFLPWLGSLYVAEDFRRNQIAQKLIEASKIKALELGYKQLYLLTFTEELSAWYACLGWSFVKRDILFENSVIIMQTTF